MLTKIWKNILKNSKSSKVGHFIIMHQKSNNTGTAQAKNMHLLVCELPNKAWNYETMQQLTTYN